MARFTTEELTRSTVYDTADNKIGGVGQVYLDDRTGDPKWVSVNTGFFGMGESFIPLRGARQDGDRLVVDYSEDVVKDAPRVEGDKHITEAEEEELFSYYSGVHDRDSDRYHD
ncbi:MAG: PRC-barrel domain-containing protein, partial [Actinomycetia bacterium]|nr:PRC-barrel domain-containing protein [Actinomycetes bacterium]